MKSSMVIAEGVLKQKVSSAKMLNDGTIVAATLSGVFVIDSSLKTSRKVPGLFRVVISLRLAEYVARRR